MAKKRPVTIWIPKHKPNKEPKFHKMLILEGEGREIIVLFTADSKGWDFIILIDIDYMGRKDPAQYFVIFTIAIKTIKR